ncbi:MAG: flagellar basal body-associated FliL family protein [Terriglobales bacterium]
MPPDSQTSYASAGSASPRSFPSPDRAPDGDAQPRSKPAKKSNIWVYACLMLAIGGGVFYWQRSPAGKSTSDAAVETTLPLETFVVNLDGSGQRAYLRVGITLGLSRPARGGKEDLPVAALRDVILSVLASAHSEQLLTADGKERLKADLLRALTDRVPQAGVQSVYFTEFLVQM